MFGSIEKKLPLQQIIKLRHSFLNGHGRLRTAFLLYRHKQYGTTRNILH